MMRGHENREPPFDLYAWQEGHKLVLMVYELVKNFLETSNTHYL